MSNTMSILDSSARSTEIVPSIDLDYVIDVQLRTSHSFRDSWLPYLFLLALVLYLRFSVRGHDEAPYECRAPG